MERSCLLIKIHTTVPSLCRVHVKLTCLSIDLLFAIQFAYYIAFSSLPCCLTVFAYFLVL